MSRNLGRDKETSAGHRAVVRRGRKRRRRFYSRDETILILFIVLFVVPVTLVAFGYLSVPLKLLLMALPVGARFANGLFAILWLILGGSGTYFLLKKIWPKGQGGSTPMGGVGD